MGHSGTSLMQGLIGPRRIFFQDDQEGSLRVFRQRVNIGTLADLTFEVATPESELQLLTRIRAEGYGYAEAVDWDRLKSEGNLFQVVNASEANTAEEAYREGLLILQEMLSTSRQTLPSSAADPRVEPNDLVTVPLPTGARNLIVEAVNFTFQNSPDSVVFDMDIEGRHAG